MSRPNIQGKWHKDCDLQYVGHSTKDARDFWCPAHHQWAYEFAVEIVYIFADPEPEVKIPYDQLDTSVYSIQKGIWDSK